MEEEKVDSDTLSYDFSLQNALRDDLVNFLEESRCKLGHDGKKLLLYPKNFEKIVEAMDRRDLLSNDPNSWSTSMLNDKFDEDIGGKFENGRYRHLFDDSVKEMKITRGLAEIHLLDRQLQSITKRAKSVSEKSPRSSRGMKEPGRRSRNDSRHEDLPEETFVTRGVSDGSDSHPSPQDRDRPNNRRRRDAGGGVSSGAATVLATVEGSLHSPVSTAVRGNSRSNLNAGAEVTPRSARSSKPSSDGKDFIQENKLAVKGAARLTREQEERLQSLLCIIPDVKPVVETAKGSHDEGAAVTPDIQAVDADLSAWKEYNRFGLTELQETRLHEIDAKLSEFNSAHMSLDGDASAAVFEVDAVLNEGDKYCAEDADDGGVNALGDDDNFLLRMRLQRSRNTYLSTLDRALQQQQREPPLNEQLIRMAEERGRGQGSARSTSSSGSRRDRALSSVLNRQVSVVEIEALVADLKACTPRTPARKTEDDPDGRLARIALESLLEKVRRDLSLAKKDVRLDEATGMVKARTTPSRGLGPSPEYEGLLAAYRDVVDDVLQVEVSATSHSLIDDDVSNRESSLHYELDGSDGSYTVTGTNSEASINVKHKPRRRAPCQSATITTDNAAVVGDDVPLPPVPGSGESTSLYLEEMRSRLNGLLLRAELVTHDCDDENGEATIVGDGAVALEAPLV